jgi:phage repressor protein C with HTH and peptisase S24 domain
MRYSELLPALQDLINRKPTAKEISEVLNFSSEKVYYTRAQRDSSFSFEEIDKLQEYYGVNLISTSCSNSVTIDYIHITPSCGRGTVVLDNADVTPVRIGKEVIKDLWKVSSPDVLKLFKASGDSMADTIEDGNILLVDTSRTDYHNGGIYVLTINNDWFVKRLRLKINGDLEIISDNTKYEPEILKPNTDIEINVVGRVIKNLSRGL